MYAIQGFVIKSNQVSNEAGVVADNFELSPYAKTYSREIGWYQHESYQGDTLSVFKAINTETGEPYVLSKDQVKEILGVTETVVAYMAVHTYPYLVPDLLSTVSAAFQGKIENFTIGALKVGEAETMPDRLSWTSLSFPGTTVKIWLNNDAFENQYSDYEIVTVSPFDQLDDFYRPYGTTVSELSLLTIPMLMERVMRVRGGIPESTIRVYDFGFHNPNNRTQSTPSYWAVIVYGKNGDNIDAIKDVIIKTILENSEHTQAEWEVIFPDIFLRTEFLLYPRWDKVAIPNLTTLSSLYSSAVDPLETVMFAKQKWSTIPASWIEANLSIVPFDYKALTVEVLNGQKNVEGKTNWRAIFPDYIPISTSSLDFNRMTVKTREWLLIVQEMLVIAESMTEYTSIANPFRRVIRDNVLYVGTMVDNVNYLVAARANLS